VKEDELNDRYTGTKFTVIHCKGAIDSYRAALKKVDARQQKKFTTAIILQIQRLADGGRMTKENFPQEGYLPKRKGQHNAKKFNALKRIPIRGYCWLSQWHKDTYFISHYIYKKRNKLNESDTNRIGTNWSRIEENGDEC